MAPITGPKIELVQRSMDLFSLTEQGIPVEDALKRVGWTVEAAYAWSVRHGHGDMLRLVLDEYNHYCREVKTRYRKDGS